MAIILPVTPTTNHTPKSNMFGSTSKQITKLTDKAKVALEGSSNKWKNDASSMTSTSKPKEGKTQPNQRKL